MHHQLLHVRRKKTDICANSSPGSNENDQTVYGHVILSRPDAEGIAPTKIHIIDGEFGQYGDEEIRPHVRVHVQTQRGFVWLCGDPVHDVLDVAGVNARYRVAHFARALHMTWEGHHEVNNDVCRLPLLMQVIDVVKVATEFALAQIRRSHRKAALFTP